MTDLTPEQQALAETEVLRLIVTGLIGLLRDKQVFTSYELSRVIDAALERAEEQQADPDGRGEAAVTHMRRQLEYLLGQYRRPTR